MNISCKTSLYKIVIPFHVSLFLLICFFVSAAHGAEPKNESIEWFNLAIGLFGGLALFLAGLDLLSEGLKKAAGDTLKTLLSKMTTNRLLGALSGAFVTAVLNSSSVTTVLVVSFITAGVMTLAQSVGVIMGANIGSTMTAQLLAFNISSYALLPVAVGFFMSFTAKRDNVKHIGMMLMGLGLVFFGMGIMGESMKPLRSYEPFMVMLESMERPVLGILAGAIFTGLVQSSAATVGIAIAMATEGLLSLEAGIALALGANIGTCATALLAALGKPVEAVRAAIVHVIFNIAGVLVWLPFIGLLASLATWISPDGGEVAEVPRQIANANTVFNVINTFLFLSFTSWFAWIAEKVYPDRPEKGGIIIEPKYLDEAVVTVPSVALEQVRLEFGRMGHIASTMLAELPKAILNRDKQHIDEIIQLDYFVNVLLNRDKQHIDEIIKLDDKIDILEAAIFSFLSKIRQQTLTQEESKIHENLMTATINLETLADVIESELSVLIKNYLSKERKISETTRQVLRELYGEVQKSLELAIQSILENDQQAAHDVINKKNNIDELAENLLSRKSEHLGRSEAVDLETARIEISLIDKMRRTYSLARRIAKTVLPPEIIDNN